MSENDVEKLLDDKIHKYNKYDKNHPMEGVTYNVTNKKYKMRFNNINITCKKIDNVIDKMNEYFQDKFSEKILKNVLKTKFLYQDHYFLIYWNNKPYFDIQHIISILNLKQSYIKEKYNEFSNNICYYIWHKNEFNGYILRELIDEETMYSIIFSSNSKLSKSFKKKCFKNSFSIEKTR